MRIVVDGQKLSANPRTTKDLLVTMKSLARLLNWQTLYDPNKEIIYVSTSKTNAVSTISDLLMPVLEELESIRLQDKIICIDAGHGGNDSGALGPSGTMEKDNTLSIAILLKEKLENNGANVIMTRSSDQDLSYPDLSRNDLLSKRVTIANDSDADIFVSIHNDSFSSAVASGTTTFHYGNEQAIELANHVQKALTNELNTNDRGTRFASFYILRYTTMPAILVETAFISNPEEELLLASNDGRNKIAESIYNGIVRYFKV
ncbi:MAG: N-acetylmuramoyl-L-alanine amidase [Massilibacillus sp.]|jgi:N-acetylmuramoyl-L-alanine amidase|nr:N-acetylmuramoyl-L-alanine amidase [Massilibacillus sp.]